MRQPHFLKANERQETPSACIYFDTETKAAVQPDGSQVLTLNFGMAVYTRKLRHGKWSSGEWYRFTDATDFWNWVVIKTRPKCKLYLFAHNLVFDMTIVHGFSILLGRKWQLMKAIVGDPPTILKYRQGKSSICLLDTFNWFHTSLAALGESMGLAKLSMPDQDADQAAWDQYCRRDAEVLQYTMMRYFDFIKTNDLGNFQMTAASQAFTAYRHRFMHHQVLIDANEPALELARQAYYGGRTEAFFVGEKTGDFYLLDVNSMYPFVMAINDFPSKLQGVYSHISMGDLPDLFERFQIIADVDLDTTEPAFPYRTRHGLVFPVGQFRTQLATPELWFALDMGYLRKIYSAALYAHVPLFARYVNTLFKLRHQYKADGNLPFASLSKLMLNSLYGKFGQRGYVFQDVGQALTDESRSWVEFQGETGQVTQHRQFGGLHQVWENEGESFNSHPAISAHVTSYARMWLWKLICEAGREHVFYCDTDSLVVDKTGYDTLAAPYLGDGLGELKLEKQFSYLVIHGCKDYEFGDVTKIKGVRKNATKIADNQYMQDHFSKFKTMVRNGNLDTMVVSRQPKHLKREYTKGTVTTLGAVTPFILPDDLDMFVPSRYLGEPGGIGGRNRSNDARSRALRDDMQANLDRGKTYGELIDRENARRK